MIPISLQEREARDAVVLPYEHQGQQYQTSGALVGSALWELGLVHVAVLVRVQRCMRACVRACACVLLFLYVHCESMCLSPRPFIKLDQINVPSPVFSSQ